MIAFTVDTRELSEGADALRRVADGLPDRLEEAVGEVAKVLNDALVGVAPVSKPSPSNTRPGMLRASIRFDLDGLTANFVAADYAGYVIGGTGPHVITGKPSLSFWWDKTGGWATFAKVNHPGTKPNDFRAPAIDQAQDDVDDELEALGDWIAEQVA